MNTIVFACLLFISALIVRPIYVDAQPLLSQQNLSDKFAVLADSIYKYTVRNPPAYEMRNCVIDYEPKASDDETEPNGYGTCNYDDGSWYRGMFKGKLRHGSGQWTFRDGRQFTGNWRYGELHGQGNLTFGDGTMCTGQFSDGISVYRSQCTSFNGLPFVGNIVLYHDGPRVLLNDGFKTYKSNVSSPLPCVVRHFSNAGFYLGMFKRQLSTADGSVYEGTFSRGLRNGIGTVTPTDGRKYEGMWSNGLMHGWGKLTFSDSSVYQGNFEHGEYEGFYGNPRNRNGILTAVDGRN